MSLKRLHRLRKSVASWGKCWAPIGVNIVSRNTIYCCNWASRSYLSQAGALRVSQPPTMKEHCGLAEFSQRLFDAV
jgi:hypothetical protein